MRQQANQKSAAVLGLAMLTSATLFFLIAVLLPVIQGSPKAPVDFADSPVPLLTLLHGASTVAAIVASRVLSARIQASDHFEYRLTVLRYATLEGAALFGIVILMIGSLEGTLPTHSLYYVNAASYVLMATWILPDLRAIKE